MKRVSLLFLILFCLLSSGCAQRGVAGSIIIEEDMVSDTSEEAVISNRYVGSLGATAVENGTALYFTIGEFLGYYDSETGESGPLCGRPECAHKDYHCDAYLNVHPLLIGCQEGKLYWLGCNQKWGKVKNTPVPMEFGIWRANLDGTGRELVKPYPEGLSNAVQHITLHRGKLYLDTLELRVTDGVPENHFCMYELELNGDDSFRMLLDCTDHAEFQIVQNFVYAVTFVVPGTETTAMRDPKILRYDLDTGETETVLQAGTAPELSAALFVSQNLVVYLSDSRRDVTGDRLYRLEAGQLTPVPGTDDEEGIYSRLFLAGELAYSNCYTADGENIWLRDLEGNTLYKGPWPIIDWAGEQNLNGRFSHGYMGGGKDRVLFCFSDFRTHSWIVCYDITADGLTETLLWNGALPE